VTDARNFAAVFCRAQKMQELCRGDTGSAMAVCSKPSPAGAGWANAASIVTQVLIEPSTGGVAKKTTSGQRL
jgi:hypothetical protein